MIKKAPVVPQGKTPTQKIADGFRTIAEKERKELEAKRAKWRREQEADAK
jgi:hypothetical protein